ncbi:hypothetical protein [Sharpea azabuensis]|uniref:hypothetical protein n=1 Tax=Sharpea azabuensis TaxID=322505 RepID=UPI001569D6CE|nr:hypothetical protein [Sharpea azabuensis]
MQDIERIFADMKKEIAEESKEEVNAILADVKKSEDDALVTMQQEAKKNADLRLKQELEEMHSEAATEISQVNSERMKKLIEKRDEYVNTIFKAVMYVRDADLKLADQLVKAYGKQIEVKASDRIQLGGLIVEDKLSALVVNETLDEALKAQHEWFNKNSGLVIK